MAGITHDELVRRLKRSIRQLAIVSSLSMSADHGPRAAWAGAENDKAADIVKDDDKYLAGVERAGS